MHPIDRDPDVVRHSLRILSIKAVRRTLPAVSELVQDQSIQSCSLSNMKACINLENGSIYDWAYPQPDGREVFSKPACSSYDWAYP